jgi:hypothetical protein
MPAKVTKTVLQRTYQTSYTVQNELCEANFYVTLECNKEARTFDMMLYIQDYFINGASNVCAWPVKEWTLETIRECLRIFHHEYLPFAQKLSTLVKDEHLVDTAILFMDGGELRRRPFTGDVADALWEALNAVSGELSRDVLGWSQRLDGNRFGVCSSFMDCGYTEDPFPFVGAMNALEEPIESNTEYYREALPTLYALSCSVKK